VYGGKGAFGRISSGSWSLGLPQKRQNRCPGNISRLQFLQSSFIA
jgi:hypothetical protein